MGAEIHGQSCRATGTGRVEGSEIVGSAPGFRRALSAARKAASCSAPVVVGGETGTGKELIARLIHRLSDRARRSFVPVNCGCLPSDLVENELFGHEAGAFTGATSAATGLVHLADRGTLFLDEIDALVPRAQVTLLRFLQQGEVRPVGGGPTSRVDCRILVASNRPLFDLVEQGLFREDLYFRLNVLEVHLPPLRERREDLPALARHFLTKFGNAYRRRGLRLEAEALAWIAAQDWPGNVRELENLLHRAVLMAEGTEITRDLLAPDPCHVQHLGKTPCRARPSSDPIEPFADAKAKAIAAWERGYLTRLMDVAGGNVTAAAARAGKERRALGKLLKKHGLETGSSGPGA
ncbi:MAG: sigma-54 dependent transcriptional regulator [Pseudomonadota bacterium]